MSRYYYNRYLEEGSSISIELTSLELRIGEFIVDSGRLLTTYLERNQNSSNWSLYCGRIGVLMTLFRINKEILNNQGHIRDCNLVPESVVDNEPDEIGLCSDYLAVKLFQCLRNQHQFDVNLLKYASANAANELLFGKAGLAILVDYFHSKGMPLANADLVRNILVCIDISKYPWNWHNKIYYGAAHGTAGILCALTRFGVGDQETMTAMCLEFVDRARLPSGNFKSSSDSTSDKLVQWCHGTPGVLPLLVLHAAHLDITVITSALDVVWKRGILRKGSGICHGLAGNGYSFLVAYLHFRQRRYLEQALVFAQEIVQQGPRDCCGAADNPYSLFEGLAGAVQFLLDVLIVVKCPSELLGSIVLFDGLKIF